MVAIRHAIENASNEPLSEEGIVAILRGEGGSGSHLRAIFGDVSLRALMSAGEATGVPLRTILGSYRKAREAAAAANPELDAALADRW